jgi:hypothetical protein
MQDDRSVTVLFNALHSKRFTLSLKSTGSAFIDVKININDFDSVGREVYGEVLDCISAL